MINTIGCIFLQNSVERVQSHCKFSKIWGGSVPTPENFLNFAKSCILFDNKKWGSPSSFFRYKSFKLKFRVFFAGHIVAMLIKLLCHKIDRSMFTNDWVVFWYHEFGINRYRVVGMTNQNLRLGKCWKLFWAALWVNLSHTRTLVSPKFPK